MAASVATIFGEPAGGADIAISSAEPAAGKRRASERTTALAAEAIGFMNFLLFIGPLARPVPGP
jgi:hypothetical protein